MKLFLRITLLLLVLSQSVVAQVTSSAENHNNFIREVQQNTKRIHDSIKSVKYSGYSRFSVYMDWNAFGLNFLPIVEEYHFNGIWLNPDSNRVEIVALRKASPDTGLIDMGLPLPNPFRFSYDVSALGTDKEDNKEKRDLAFLSLYDIEKPIEIATTLIESKLPIYRFLYESFEDSTKRIFQEYGDFTQPIDSLERRMKRKLQREIAKNLNVVIRGDALYSHELFREIKLSKKTKKMIDPNEENIKVTLTQRNRMLLDDTFKKKIRKMGKNVEVQIRHWPLFPFAVGADSAYNYETRSEIGFGNRKIIEVYVEPKRPDFPGMRGVFQIDPDDLVVVGSDVVFTEATHYFHDELSRDKDMPFLLKPMLKIDEDHRSKTSKALVHSLYWLPVSAEEFVYMKAWGIKIVGSREMHFTSYEVNPIAPSDTFEFTDEHLSYNIDPVVDSMMSTNWIDATTLAKDFEEDLIEKDDNYISSLQLEKELFNTSSIFEDALNRKISSRSNAVIDLAKRFRSNFIYNRVEGLHLDYRLPLVGLLGKKNAVLLTAGYGVEDQRFKGKGTFIQYLDKLKRLFVQSELYNTITFNEDLDLFSNGKNSFSSFFMREDYRDYYYKQGGSISLGFRATDNLAFKAAYSNHTEVNARKRDVFSTIKWDKPFRLNPDIVEGRFSGVNASVLYQTAELYAGLQAEYTNRDKLGGDFTYSRFSTELKYTKN